MDLRQKDLNELHSYIEETDKEITMVLQSLQWDQKHLLEETHLVACQYDAGHRVPPDKKESHEGECFLRCQGYNKNDRLLPDLLDPAAPTVVKLCKEDIRNIINYVSQSDPAFKRGPGCGEQQPLSAERLQATYTADERRAIHDAVTCATPLAHVLGDLVLPSNEQQEKLRKSRQQVLAELRDMKRRRVRYRGAAPAANYSHTLRGLIQTQMEMYTGLKPEETTTNNATHVTVKREPESFGPSSYKTDKRLERQDDSRHFEQYKKQRYEYKAEKHRERSSSVDRKRHKPREYHREKDDDRYSKSHSRYDDEVRNKMNRHERGLKTEDPDSRERIRDYEVKRRDRDSSIESRASKSRNGNEKKKRSHRYNDYEESSSKYKSRHRERGEDKHRQTE